MQDHFFTTKFCDRCNCSLEGKSRQMSRFNTDCLCHDCVVAEQQHPDYDKAVKAECEAIRNGDYNFKGIGMKKKRQSAKTWS